MAGRNLVYEEERGLEPSAEEKDTIFDWMIMFPATPSFDLSSARSFGILNQVLESEETAHLVPYHNMLTEAENCIRKDDKAEFKYLLENNKDLVHNFPAKDLFQIICKGNAPGCAAAFFDAGFHVDVNEQFSDQCYPLEYAARYLSCDLTRVLLQHGANPNVRVEDNDEFILDVALAELCNNEYAKQWNREKSIFKLFYLLCLPALKEPLDTIHLLASSTKKCMINSILKCLIIQCKSGCSDSFIQLIAFLMAEKDNLLVPSAEAGGSLETTPLGQLFSTPFFQSKWESLKELYNDLETFWRALDVLERYRHSPSVKSVSKRQVPFDIARALMNEAKLEMKPEDVNCTDIRCFRPINYSNAKDLAKQNMQHVGSSLHSSLWKRAMSTSWLSSSSIPTSSPFRAFHNVNLNMKKSVEVVQLSSKTMPMKPPVSRNVLASGKICAPLIRIAKRSIK